MKRGVGGLQRELKLGHSWLFGYPPHGGSLSTWKRVVFGTEWNIGAEKTASWLMVFQKNKLSGREGLLVFTLLEIRRRTL